MEEQKKLFFSCGVKNNKLYGNMFNGRCLMNLNLDDSKFNILKDGNIRDAGWLGGTDFLFHNDKIYIVANRFNMVAEYSLADGECSYWPFEEYSYTPASPNYSLCLLKNDRIFVFPRFDNCLRVFDTSKHEIVKRINLGLDSSYVYDEEKQEELVAVSIQVENVVWLFARKKQNIWKYSLFDGMVTKYLWGGDGECIDITWKNGKFYILNNMGQVFTWESESKETKLLCRFNEGDNYFQRIAVTAKYMWLLPGLGENIYCYDFVKEEAHVYKDLPDNFNYIPIVKGQAKFYQGCEDENFYYFAMCASTHIMIIDKKRDKVIWIYPEYRSHKEKIKQICIMYEFQSKLYKNKTYETDCFSLKDYMMVVGGVSRYTNNETSVMGEKLLRYVLGRKE